MKTEIIINKKHSAVFLFENTYTHHTTISNQKATVRLEIDYLMKNYSIKPDNGTKHFNFNVASHENNKWKAVLKGINQAIDFANKELIKQ